MKKFLKKFKKYRKIMIITAINLVLFIVGFIYNQLIPTLISLAILDFILFLIFKPKKKKFSFKELFKTFFIIGFTLGSLSLIGATAFIFYIVSITDEFKPEELHNTVPSVIVDKNGNEMMKIGNELRVIVDYDEMSQALIDAVVATEDSRYYQHSGVDLPRFIIASVNQAMGVNAGGASTITMQVSKLTQTSDVATGFEGIVRKFQDVYLSVFELERRYTKEEILEFYLNYVGMGGMVNGVGQASLTYFGKDVSELNTAEAAMLAGMLQSPEYYNPLYYPEECEQRRQEVLYLMLRHEYISEEEYEIAKELTVDKLLVEQDSSVTTSEYQDYLDTVIAEVIDRTGLNPASTSMIITVNIDTELQDHINKVMSGEIYNWPDEYIQAGTVVLDIYTGEILAVGAGRDRVAGDWNFATQINRHIGSTAKPLYDYGPAIEYLNYNTYTPVVDEPYSYSHGVELYNIDFRYRGLITLTESLKQSRNTTALKVFQAVNNDDTYEFVTNLGLHPETDSTFLFEGHSLGAYNGENPVDMAAAYAAFGNGGYYIEPHTVSTIEYIETEEVFTVKPETHRAMSEETAFMITTILEQTSVYTFGGYINGINSASKTGTATIDSDDVKEQGLNGNVNDKWLVGYNENYAISMWLGYESNHKDTYNVYSFNSRESLFKKIAEGVFTEWTTWDQPDGVVKVNIETGLPEATLPSENTPSGFITSAYFKKGFEPTETSSRFETLDDVTGLTYDEVTGLLTWTGIEQPDFYNEEYLNEIYSPLYTDPEYLEKQIEAILSQNNSTLGTLVYDIYTQNDDGTLTLIGSTEDTSYQQFVNGTTTFVVKASYSKFKSSSSDGVSVSIQKTPDIITLELTTNSSITLNINDSYLEPTSPVRVFKNGIEEVTTESEVTYTIVKKSDESIVNSFNELDTSVAEIYTVTYTIKYQAFTDTITKIIEVIDTTETP